jgi:hypothetical protein
MISFKDYIEEGKRGLWDNIHAKQERIKNGSGERMRKPGSKGAPTAADFKASEATSKNEEVELTEGAADKLGDKIDNAESSEHAKSIISKAPTKHLQYLHHWNMGLSGGRTHKDMPHIKAELTKRKSLLSSAESSKHFDESIEEDAKGYKNPTGGLTQKGRDHYNNKYGSHLKAPVTTPPSELKAGSKAANRRKSFCARMSGVEGPMKKPNGEPTRKALALRKWNC